MNIRTFEAAKLISQNFGILGGIGAGIHGVGEIIQGNIKPDNIFIPSWTTGPIALYFDGDPAITIFPSMLIAGLVTVIISFITIVCSILYLKNRKGGKVLVVIAIMLLFSGGGVGPPVLTLLAGLAGLGIGAEFNWWSGIVKAGTGNVLARVWPYIYSICLLNGIFLVVGHIVAAYFFAPVNGEIFSNSFLLSVPLLIISIITGIYFDLSRKLT